MKSRIILIVFLFAFDLLAQNAGNTGYSFLKIGAGASEVAQAEAVTSKLISPFSVHYNPALVTNLNYSSIGLMHNEWIQDLRSEFLVANSRLFGIPFFLTLNSTSISDIEIRLNPGSPQGTFDAHYFSAGFGTGLELLKNFSVGFQLKYLYENIYVNESFGYAFDLGLFKKNILPDLDLGLSLRNIGKVNELDSESASLPSEVRFGLSYSGNLYIYKFNFLPTFDVQKFLNESRLNFLFGLEINYDNLFSIRSGYNTTRDLNKFSFGFGIGYKSIHFDYAFLPFTNNFGSANIISLYIKL